MNKPIITYHPRPYEIWCLEDYVFTFPHHGIRVSGYQNNMLRSRKGADITVTLIGSEEELTTINNRLAKAEATWRVAGYREDLPTKAYSPKVYIMRRDVFWEYVHKRDSSKTL